MRCVNDPEITHAGQFGPCHGYFPIIPSGKEKEAVNPIDGTVAGNNAQWKIGGA
jgi:hypothetical protein